MKLTHTNTARFNSPRHRRMLLFVVTLFAVLVLCAPAYATTYSPTTSSGLTDALSWAVPGDIIILQAGMTYEGSFVLPNKSGSGTITIESSQMSSLGAGVRVGPGDASYMPKIKANSSAPALYTEPGAHDYVIRGIEFAPSSTSVTDLTDLVRFGDVGTAQDTYAEVPYNLTLDRCYIHGLEGHGEPRRGVALQSKNTTVSNCYISNIKQADQDPQAIGGWNGPGPFRIVNNYLESTGINLLFGGALPDIDRLVPTDIEIRHNHITKRLTWKEGQPGYVSHTWRVKCLFELTNARHVTFEDNLLEHSWIANNAGGYGAINLTPNGNSGSWVTVEDVVIRNNIVRRVSDALNIGSQATSANGRNIRIHNNLFYEVNASLWPGGSGRFMTLSNLPGLVIDHNTVINSGDALLVYGQDSGGYITNPGFVMTNNILNSGSSGIFGAGTGNPTFTAFFPGAVFKKNLLAGTYSHGYQYSNFTDNFYPDAITEAGFVNYGAKDFRLVTTLPNNTTNPLKYGGTDGRDVGADIRTVEWATGVTVAESAAFVQDFFTGTSGTLLSAHTGELGAAWTKHPSYSASSIYISNANRAYGDASSLYYASGTPATADYDVQADLNMVSADCTAGVAGRVSTSGNTYYRATYQPGNGEYYLDRVSGGTVTTLQHLAPWTWGGSFGTNDSHTIKLVMRGSSIKVYVDGVERLSATDSTITAAGRAGAYFGSYGGSNTLGIHLDNFTATNAP